jgi:hypothetical protein
LLFSDLAKHSVERIYLTHYPDRLVGKQSALRKLAKSCQFQGRVFLVDEGMQVAL